MDFYSGSNLQYFLKVVLSTDVVLQVIVKIIKFGAQNYGLKVW